MTDIAKALHGYLQSKTAVTNIVGTRIYPDAAPQSAVMPYLIISEVSGRDEAHMSAGANLGEGRWQFTGYCTDSVTRHALRRAIRGSLHGFRGTMGAASIQRCHQDGRFQAWEAPRDAGQVGRLFFADDYIITYTDTVPTF